MTHDAGFTTCLDILYGPTGHAPLMRVPGGLEMFGGESWQKYHGLKSEDTLG